MCYLSRGLQGKSASSFVFPVAFEKGLGHIAPRQRNAPTCGSAFYPEPAVDERV